MVFRLDLLTVAEFERLKLEDTGKHYWGVQIFRNSDNLYYLERLVDGDYRVVAKYRYNRGEGKVFVGKS